MSLIRTVIALCFAVPVNAAEFMVTEATNIGFDLDRTAGDIVFDLYQRLWNIPTSGGTATPIDISPGVAERPRISPDGSLILVETQSSGREQIWRIDTATGMAEIIAAGPWNNRMPVWHPGGARIAFSSDRAGAWHVWEIDLASGELAQRSFGSGDDLYPAYSGSGSNLVWTQDSYGGGRLFMARLPAAGTVLYTSPNRLSAPGVRPDDTLITFLERRDNRTELRMLLPLDPAVVKTLIVGPDFSDQPPVWLDRQHALIAADGKIRKMTLGETDMADIPWTAWISVKDRSTRGAIGALGDGDFNNGSYVVRVGRIFDGLHADYRRDVDILIQDDRIRAISESKEWGEGIPVIDYRAYAAIPGLIGITGSDKNDLASGPLMLASGITSLAMPNADATDDAKMPAPSPALVSMNHIADIRGVAGEEHRAASIEQAKTENRTILTNRLYPDVATGAALFGGLRDLPVSPNGFVYRDIAGLLDIADVTLFLAAGPESIPPWEMRRVLSSKQWQLFLGAWTPDTYSMRGHTPWQSRKRLAGLGKRFILDAGGTGLPVGLGLHATMGTLASEGVPPHRILQSATLDAALALGVGGDIGSIETNKLADIVIVRGDPLGNIDATLDIVAIIRRGALFSVEGIASVAGGRTSNNFTYRLKSGIVAR